MPHAPLHATTTPTSTFRQRMGKTALSLFFAIVGIILPISVGAQKIPPPKIQEPLVPVSATGEHLQRLEKLRHLLTIGNVVEFYKEATLIDMERIKKINRPNYRETAIPESQADVAFTEWFNYYRITAPFLPLDSVDKTFQPCGDIFVKLFAYESICNNATDKTAKILAIDEGRLLRQQVENLVEIQVCFHKLRQYAIDTKAHEKEDAPLLESLRVNIPMTRENYKDWRKKDSETHAILQSRDTKRATMKIYIGDTVNFSAKPYLNKLVKCFPKQGATVQLYMEKGGLRTNAYDKAYLLEGLLGRTEKTKWLFVGLPSPKEMERIRKERDRKAEEEYQRRLAEFERAKLKTETDESRLRKQAEAAR